MVFPCYFRVMLFCTKSTYSQDVPQCQVDTSLTFRNSHSTHLTIASRHFQCDANGNPPSNFLWRQQQRSMASVDFCCESPQNLCKLTSEPHPRHVKLSSPLFPAHLRLTPDWGGKQKHNHTHGAQHFFPRVVVWRSKTVQFKKGTTGQERVRPLPLIPTCSVFFLRFLVPYSTANRATHAVVVFVVVVVTVTVKSSPPPPNLNTKVPPLWQSNSPHNGGGHVM